MRRFFVIGFLAAAFFGPRPAAQAETVNWIQAIVGDAVITGQQIIQATVGFASAIHRENPGQPDSYYSTRINAQQDQVFKDFVDHQVVLQDFKRLEKDNHAKIPESWIDDSIRTRMHDPLFADDRAQFVRYLQARGQTMEEYRAEVRDEIIYNAMRNEFVHEPVISPHKMEAYYQAHQDAYKVAERVRLQQIFLKRTEGESPDDRRRRADNILADFKKGAAFAELARTYSALPPEVGAWREITSLDQAFRDAVNRLKPGECSEVVETADGCFLLLLVERDPAHVAQLADVRDDVEKALRGEETNRRLENWVKRLRAKTFIQEY